jgi:ketosteroid isomerase-like protein
MLSWLAGSMLRRSIRALNAGDVGPALKAYAGDAELVFPGDSSFGGTYRGKAEIEGFLRRFVECRLRLEPHVIVAKGWPWKMTIWMQMTDQATDQQGNVVYANRGVIVAKAAWGKVKHQEDYIDTQKVAAFDAFLLLSGEQVSTGTP